MLGSLQESQGSPQTTARQEDDEGRLGSTGIPGGCAGSRLDHGCKIPSGEAALAADFSSIVAVHSADRLIRFKGAASLVAQCIQGSRQVLPHIEQKGADISIVYDPWQLQREPSMTVAFWWSPEM